MFVHYYSTSNPTLSLRGSDHCRLRCTLPPALYLSRLSFFLDCAHATGFAPRIPIAFLNYSLTMAPFRNFLSRKSAAPSNGEEITTLDNTSTSRLSIDGQRSTPLSFRKSFEKEPPEYKLSGMKSLNGHGGSGGLSPLT